MTVDELDTRGRNAVGDRNGLLRIAGVVFDDDLDLLAANATLLVDRCSSGIAPCLN